MRYSYQGNLPDEKPTRIRMPDGTTRTGAFTETELLVAGYTPVPEPTVLENQVVSWNKNTISWDVRDKTQEELATEAEKKRQYAIKSINRIRDQRISSGFEFNGHMYDSTDKDQKRISGASLLAFMAIMQGAQANNFLWHGGTEAFSWITQDNQTVPMDAQTVVMFGRTAAEWERKHIFAARQLKDADPIPTDYFEDVYWE